MALKADLVRYIQENLAPDTAIDDTTALIDKGILDSMGLMQVIMFIEENFGFSVDNDDAVPENFDTVNAIVAYIEKKRG